MQRDPAPDPPHGIRLGVGGTFIEVIRDFVTLLLPVRPEGIRTALHSLKLWPVLDGARGRPRADVDAAVEAISVIVNWALADSTVSELEVNPLILRQAPTTVETIGTTALITLDRPKANAVDVATSKALYAAFSKFEADPQLRVAVLTGRGTRFFSAGWDLKAAAGGEAVDADHGPGGFAGLTEYFTRTKPIIAAVNGLALGGGFELALAADLIVASSAAEFALTEVRLGMIADSGGVLRLPKLLPTAVALEMLMTGRRMGAAEAERWGLTNRTVEPSEVVSSALELAEEISCGAPLALRAIKEVVLATQTLDVEEGFALMRSGQLEGYQTMLSSADFCEGSLAFAEKRGPVWQGR
ncbi:MULTISPECIES: enoyl-CoA hydratase-related protein [unclassified Brevibacterium]|uniref:enoyl-CoA hydratase-related protein n=1 Tax=unclassified Brevibacterium TaxID=2614124 RepID=UPI0010804C62|nr:enoyl-CoA hydratase-related protein [Brevibacterium sp. S111]